MHRWIHHGPDHEELTPSRAESGSQAPAQASCPASSTCTELQSSQHCAMSAAHAANGNSSEQLFAQLHAKEKAPSISGMPAEAHEQGRAEISMQSSMQQGLESQSAIAAGSHHTQRHDSKAGASVKALSEAGSCATNLDRSVVAEMCSLFQDASVLVGMHPDQVCYISNVNADTLITCHTTIIASTWIC